MVLNFYTLVAHELIIAISDNFRQRSRMFLWSIEKTTVSTSFFLLWKRKTPEFSHSYWQQNIDRWLLSCVSSHHHITAGGDFVRRFAPLDCQSLRVLKKPKESTPQDTWNDDVQTKLRRTGLYHKKWSISSGLFIRKIFTINWTPRKAGEIYISLSRSCC